MRHKKSIHIPDAPVPAPGATPGRVRPPIGSQRAAGSRRYLVAWLPCFRLERCGWSAEDPVVLVAEQQSALRVQAMTPVAASFGLLHGMTVSEARAIEPTLKVEHLDDQVEERFDLDALSLLFEKLSPHIQPLPPSAISVEIRGDERRALRQAQALLDDLGHLCRIAIGDEVQGTLALARWGEGHRIVPAGGMAAALAGLPVSALQPSERLGEVLQALGLRHLGELAAIPASSVAARFGQEGLRLHRIARGALPPEPLPPIPERQRLGFRRQLPDPVAQRECVLVGGNDLAGRLQAALRARDLAAVRLQLRLEVESAPDFLLPVRLGQPRRLAREIMTVIRQRLKELRLPGLVVEVELQVLEQVHFTGRQQDLLDRGQREPAEDLLGRLADALGEGALYRPELQERHRPELEWTAGVFDLRSRSDTPMPPRHRPRLLLRECLPIRVELSPWGEPQALQIEGRWVPVRSREGPERLRGEWWEKEPFDRDYWACTLADGRRAWAFVQRQDEDRTWWLHGWFD